MLKLAVLCCVLLAAAAGIAQAALLPYGGSIALTTTNWSNSITIPKFDPALGTLTCITFSLTGHVEGNARFESLDAAPATITTNLSANVALQRPDLSVIVVSLPVVSSTDNVTAFDGTIDYGGGSGRTYSGLFADDTVSAIAPPPAGDLTLFTAAFAGETITLPVVATGTSEATGAGNLLVIFGTKASASATVTYDYVPVPEPSSLLGLMACTAGLATAALRRRR